MLETALSTDSFLNQIFAQVNLTLVGNDFMCVPPFLSGKDDKRKVFLTGHRLPVGYKLLEGSITKEVTILFSENRDRLDTLRKKYPGLVYAHESEVFYKYIQNHLNKVEDKYYIFTRQLGENTLMLVTRGKSLLLFNQFLTKDKQDLFYFTMLAIEQLELDIENTTFVWFETGASEGNEIKELFENYIGRIDLIHIPDGIHSALYMGIQCA